MATGPRALYYAGGVIMNVAFALLVFPLVFHHGVEFTAPVIGRVDPGGLAWQADLRPGDRVLRVGGKPIYAFENLRVEIALAGRKPVRLEIERDGQLLEKFVQTEYDADEGFRRISVAPMVEPRPAEIDVREGSPAWQAGLRDGQRLRAVDGVPVLAEDADRVLGNLAHQPIGKPVALEVVSPDGTASTVRFTPEPAADHHRIGVRPVQPRVVAVRHDFAPAQALHAGDEIVAVEGQPFVADSLRSSGTGPDPLTLRVRRTDPVTGASGELDVRLHLTPEQRAALPEQVVLAPARAAGGVPVLVTADGPAAAAGMRDGDRLVAIDGRPVAQWSDLIVAVAEFRGGSMACDLVRDGQRLTLTLQPAKTADLAFGVSALFQQELYQVKGVGAAIQAGLVCSADLLKQLYVTLKEMLTGDVSAKNLGGIIQISRVSYAFAESGVARFLYFLAMLSLNLAFVNVLPIPVLDGGHLLFVLIEKIKGSPVSARVHGYSLTLGLVFVVGLMVFVTYNDILRLF
jgi:regulator of sigma E protease